MSLPKTSEKSVYLDREEHFHKGNVGAKTVVPYFYNSNTDTLSPSGPEGLLPFEYDDIALSYTGTDLTGVVYKLSGSTVATLALTYVNGLLTEVART